VTILIIVVSVLLVTYIFLLLNLSRGLTKISSFELIPSPQKFVSVIISVHNEAHNLPGLLSALALQNYPQNLWEIIIADDRSTDHTQKILQEYSATDEKLRIIYFSKTPSDFSPKKYAIDRAIENARGSIILLTDADGRPGSEWIRTVSSYFSGHTGMVIGYAPYIINPPYHHFFYKILALEYMSHACISAATTGLGFPVTCVGTNIAYYKSVYTDLGGFGKYKNYHSGDDDLFMQRVRDESNWGIAYACKPVAHVYNAPPSSWKQFFNQRLRYASKGFFYPKFVTASLLIFLLFNVILLVLPFLIIYEIRAFLFLSGVLIIKSFSEFILLYKFAGLTDQKSLLKYFLPAALLHVPYIVFFGLLGSILKYSWAGREK